MFRALLGVAACGLVMASVPAASAQNVQERIRQSIASYPGSCPCPYSVDRGGRHCGGRSAWSRGGGRAPICFAADLRGAGTRRR